MVFSNFGRERIAISLGSPVTNNFISYFAVGSGSGAELTSNTQLVNEFARFPITGSPDFTESRKVTFIGDLNSIVASGLVLTEIGLLTSGAAFTGSTWSRETLLGSFVFDGTVEGQFTSTVEVM